MDENLERRFLRNPFVRVVHWVLPWVFLAAVLYVLSGYWNTYQKQLSARPSGNSGEASRTVDATGMPLPSLQAVAMADVQLRDAPDEQGTVLLALPKGSPLELVERRGEWYRARTPDGHIGWVPAAADLVQMVK